jgi:hypothetical protein
VLGPERLGTRDRTQERGLHEIFGVGRSRREEHRDAQQLVGAPVEQHGQCLAVALTLERREQFFVAWEMHD